MTEAIETLSADQIRPLVKAELDQAGIAFSAKYVGETTRDKWQCDAWRVKLGTFETDYYYTGLGHRRKSYGLPEGKPQTPSAADVLYSLLSDATACEQSFSDWCGEVGYDSDSIKALNTYQACCKIGEELRRILPAKRRTI